MAMRCRRFLPGNALARLRPFGTFSEATSSARIARQDTNGTAPSVPPPPDAPTVLPWPAHGGSHTGRLTVLPCQPCAPPQWAASAPVRAAP